MKWILVTGACGGLGKSIVGKLLMNGYGIWAADVNQEILEKEFMNQENVQLFPCDLNSEDELIKMMKAIIAQTGPLSGLIHCAGINKFIQLHLIKRRQMEEIFQIHVFAGITLCSMLSKKGFAERGASIVLFSSIAAHEGSSGNSVYASAKSAVEGFVRSSAHDFAEKGIRINAIIPGDVNAGMFRRFLSQLTAEQADDREKKYPLGFGESGNISDLVEFLLSEKASWITGQCYVIDGGHSVQRI